MERVRRFPRCLCRLPSLWRSSKGYKYRLGKAVLQFFSGDKRARVVGATANLLLSIDEAQLIAPAKFDKDFDPMSASVNATRVFWGTAWVSGTLLERQRRYALRLQEADGIQRVFFYTAEDVRRVSPKYGQHVDRVISELGRNHPLVRTQYFCETMDAQSGMFTPARNLLLIFPSQCGRPPATGSGRPEGVWAGGASRPCPASQPTSSPGEFNETVLLI